MESFPYNSNDIRSIYHTREFQFHKLNHFSSPLDVFISHDWPNGITDYGNVNQLLRFKPFFKDDISRGRLGSPPSMDLLKNLRPRWWFGSHLHCRFTATVNHKPLESEQLDVSANNEDEIDLDELESSASQSKLQVKNDDEIDLDGDDEVINIPQQASKNEDEIDLDDENDEVINIPQQASNNNEDEIDLDEDSTTEPRNFKRFKSPIFTPKQINTNQTTQFLALDKCLPRRHFMEIVEIPLTDPDTNTDQKLQLEYNLEWLAIVKAFNELTPTRPTQSKLRFKEKEVKEQIERNLIALEQATKLGSFDKTVPQNFSQIAPTQANHSSVVNNGPGNLNFNQFSIALINFFN
jgi:lariat debranching enzyme